MSVLESKYLKLVRFGKGKFTTRETLFQKPYKFSEFKRKNYDVSDLISKALQRVRFQIKKFEMFQLSKRKFLQRILIFNQNFTTCQILNQNFKTYQIFSRNIYNVSNFFSKILQLTRLWIKIITTCQSLVRFFTKWQISKKQL